MIMVKYKFINHIIDKWDEIRYDNLFNKYNCVLCGRDDLDHLCELYHHLYTIKHIVLRYEYIHSGYICLDNYYF